MDFAYKEKMTLDAYKNGKYDQALETSLELSRYNNKLGLFTCGLIYELGISSKGTDLSKAYKYFDLLSRQYHDDEGLLGCARIMIIDKSLGSKELAEEYCLEAIKISRNKIAYLNLGRVYEELFGSTSFKLSRKAYITAAFKGAAWGWRNWAIIEFKWGSVMLSIFIHVLATIFYPLYFILGGKDAIRQQ